MTSPEEIIHYLRTQAGRPLKAKELARGLGVDGEEYAEFKALLHDMEDRGQLYRVQRQRYAAPRELHLVVGQLATLRSGAGFVSPDDRSGDVFIPADALESAVDGDRVVARVERSRRGQRREGSIIKILQRARETVVGVFHAEKNYGFVRPEDPKLGRSVFVPPQLAGGARAGEVVVVRISSWGDRQRGPTGEVERVLGPLGDPGVDVLAVIYGHELPVDFPAEVDQEAQVIRQRGLVEVDVQDRVDLRDDWVFTIDPVDAKDHDDALSIRSQGEIWEVGIHIADVSFYVGEGSALDAEALRRGTSVYLVDRTIPMLPHALSSDLCSLLPDQDRLAVSLLLELNEDAEVLRHRLVRSVIRSRHKLSYEQAQTVLDVTASIDAATDGALQMLIRLSRRLRARRLERGSLDFDLPEARVTLNPTGEPIDIQPIERLESHRLIEDFMLLANETIAGRTVQSHLPYIYRVHEPPDQSRLDQLKDFAQTFGHRLSRRTTSPKEIQLLLESIQGRPEEKLLSTVVLRSMKQARYSHESLGHFGLAARHYTHFTSPIRRYPDLVAHRLALAAFVDRDRAGAAATAGLLPDIARLSSERERVAVDAERDSIELKKVEFMQRHLGSDFAGTISGVAQFGFFVLLDDFYVEGLVHVSSLEDDYYSFYEEHYALIGEHHGQRFQLGERVRVQVAAVHLEERKIDFLLLEHEDRARLPTRRRAGARRKRAGARTTRLTRPGRGR